MNYHEVEETSSVSEQESLQAKPNEGEDSTERYYLKWKHLAKYIVYSKLINKPS